MLDIISISKESIKSMLLKKQRTFLALLGIIIGIGSVIAMISIGEIVKNQAIKQFEALGTNILTVNKSYSSNPKSKTIDLKIIKELKFLNFIDSFSAYININGNVRIGNKNMSFASVMGVTPSFFDINKIKIQSGRALLPVDKNSDNCVIGLEIKNFLKKSNSDYIIFNNHIFNIVGYLGNDTNVGIRNFDIDNTIFMDIYRAASFIKKPSIDKITIKVKQNITNDEAKKKLKEFFSLKKINVDIRSPDELIAQMNKQVSMFALLLGAIGSISLLVGGIGIMNVMLVSVSERKKEIGIRRAIGAKQIDIQMHFLIESLILTIVGGLLGIVIGIITSWSIAKFSNWEFILSTISIIAGILMSLVVGVFFGFYPARQAAKMDPIHALRTE